MYKLRLGGVTRLVDAVVIPDDINNTDWASYLDWVAAGNTPEPKFTQAELAAAALVAATAVEGTWRAAELLFIADQLLRIEDSDPIALPGTAEQWRAYRVQVRAHVSPDTSDRPTRPE